MGKEKKKRKLSDIENETIDETEKKVKSEVIDADQPLEEGKDMSYEDKLKFVNVIAKPMASKKLTKKLCKLVRKASKQKTFLRNGLKVVQNRIRRGETGLVVFAGDVTPIEMMCHLPAVCEEKNIPYVYVPRRVDLGNALGMQRGCLMVLIRSHEDYIELFDDCVTEVKKLPIPIYDPHQTF